MVFEILNDTKYAKAYLKLIDGARSKTSTEYSEKHHVIPKSLGGSNTKDNLVRLSGREHFVAHLLLPKAVAEPEHRKKMAFALTRMLSDRTGKRYKPSSRIIAAARKAHAEMMKGRIDSPETRAKKSKPKSEQHKNRIKQALTGLKKTPEHIAKINQNPEKIRKTAEKHTGMKRSEVAKSNMSLAMKGRTPFNAGTKVFSDGHGNIIHLASGEKPPAGFIAGNIRGKGKAGGAGKKWWYDPRTLENKTFVPGEEPEGWLPGSLHLRRAKK